MLVVVALAIFILFLKWITRRFYCPVPDRLKRDTSKLKDLEADKDAKQGRERLQRKRAAEEAEEAKRKPKDIFEELDEIIEAKKKIKPPSRPRSKYEGALFLSEWKEYESKVANAYQTGRRKTSLSKEEIEEMKENIRKCKY